jgi:DNA-directed RNA polymerase subunit E'/Rpb7
MTSVAKQDNTYGVFHRSLLNMKVILKITEVGTTLKQNLERKIIQKTEGKCIAEGYIRPNSVRVVNYSSGNINGEYVEFQVSFECMVCYPVEGMVVDCTVKTITKAGIHAEVVVDDKFIPLTIFIARDHNYTNKYFSQITENMNVQVKIIGIRFELNDAYICAIATLVDPGKEKQRERNTNKPKLVVAETENVDLDLEVM